MQTRGNSDLTQQLAFSEAKMEEFKRYIDVLVEAFLWISLLTM